MTSCRIVGVPRSQLVHGVGLAAVFERPALLQILVSDQCTVLGLVSLLRTEHVGLRILTFFFCISLNPGNNLCAHNTEFQHILAPYEAPS